MSYLVVTDTNGETKTIEGKDGYSVMEILRDAGYSEILAQCGGCRSCATCHVHVDPDWFDRFPPMSPDEHDLLESLNHRDRQSRLSCQLPFSRSLEGLRVTITQVDF